MRHPLRRLTTVLATTAAALVPVVGLAAPARAVPPTPVGLPSAAEDLARYVGADSCDGRAKPGTVALGELLKKAYPTTSYGTVRACGSDSLSTTEHYDGRAVDWMGPNARNTTAKKWGDDVVAWLLATDKAGNQFANARRLGVMYVIWNNSAWDAYDGFQKQPYSTCAQHPEAAMDTTCHRNHVHLSLSWEGAMKRTSFWTKTVAAPDYGPCRTPELNWAAPYRSPRTTPCDRYPKVSAPASASTLTKKLVGYSGMYVHYGSGGPVVSAVQQAIGLTPDGAFGSGTASALKSWQARNCVPATGAADLATWRALTHATPPAPAGPVVPGFDADGNPDLLARTSTGALVLYPGDASGGFRAGRTVGTGWGGFTALLSPGDFTGDGKADLLARRADGGLCLWRGNGTGGWATSAQLVGTGWGSFTALFGAGDFTGDGKADVIGRTADGVLHLYAGTGTGRFSGARVIGAGWNIYNAVFSPGDLTGDGRPDVVTRTKAGLLYLYAGNGAGGFAGRGTVIGRGWDGFASVLSAGDLTGDHVPDLLGRTSSGLLKLYAGTGTGRIGQASVVPGTWTQPTLVGIR